MHREMISSVSLVHSKSEREVVVNDVISSVIPSVALSVTPEQSQRYGGAVCIPLSFINVRDVHSSENVIAQHVTVGYNPAFAAENRKETEVGGREMVWGCQKSIWLLICKTCCDSLLQKPWWVSSL
jgi:hypothetical protein